MTEDTHFTASILSIHPLHEIEEHNSKVPNRNDESESSSRNTNTNTETNTKTKTNRKAKTNRKTNRNTKRSSVFGKQTIEEMSMDLADIFADTDDERDETHRHEFEDDHKNQHKHSSSGSSNRSRSRSRSYSHEHQYQHKKKSMDLTDVFTDAEDEWDETHRHEFEESCSHEYQHNIDDLDIDDIDIDIDIEDDDLTKTDEEEEEKDLCMGPNPMGSQQKMDDLPSSSSKQGDNSTTSSLNWRSLSLGSVFGSFRNSRGSGNSFGLGLGSSRNLSGLGLGSSRSLFRRNDSVKATATTATAKATDLPKSNSRRKKVVRFLKFETVFPSNESYRTTTTVDNIANEEP